MSRVQIPLAAPTTLLWRATSANLSQTIYAGTSGWSYASWKPGFYPAKTPAKALLAYYGSRCNSVEVNYTFRALPTNEQLEGWLAAVPNDFRFSFKAPQRITHMKRLKDCGQAVEEFVASLAPAIKAGKLGLLLFQLPPNFKADVSRLDDLLAVSALKGLRVAFEFRHESWFIGETYGALREHEAALCIAESEDLQTPEIHTAAAFTCFRLRQPGGYTAQEVNRQAEHFRALSTDREVFAYFKHEDEPTGALAASALLKQIGRA